VFQTVDVNCRRAAYSTCASEDDAEPFGMHTEKVQPPPHQNWPWPVQIIRLLVALLIAVAVCTALVVLVLVGARPI
jgi:hypothetical protein